MKAMNHFIVKLEKTLNDTMTTDTGIEIHVVNKFNEFEHRVMEGPVTAIPAKHETPVKVGDTLYFHHRVVLQEGQPLGTGENEYLVLYNPNTCVSNQAIAYKEEGSGDVHALGDWCLMTPVSEEDEVTAEIIEIITKTKPAPKKARLWKGNNVTKELGVSEGDVIAINKNMDYSIKIDGQERFRVDPVDLLFVYND